MQTKGRTILANTTFKRQCMSDNSVVVINNDHLDWIRKHPDHFVNLLISRLQSGETDPYPGYARWNGDACPGVQVVQTVKSNFPSLILVENSRGRKFMNVKKAQKGESQDLLILRKLAHRLGYMLEKGGTTKRQSKTGFKPRQRRKTRTTNR